MPVSASTPLLPLTPAPWPGLPPSYFPLPSQIINGILETANSIFKRFRNVFESNAIKATLK